MSIPLIQDNQKDSINASLIAIKREEERLQALIAEADEKIAQLNELKVNKSDIVDEVTLNNMQSVTSNAVAVAFSKCFPKYANKVLIFSGKTYYNANYTVPDNGFLMCSGWGSEQSTSFIIFSINGIKIGDQGNSDERISVVLPVKKGNVVNILIYLSQKNDGCYFVPCN